MNVPGDVRSFFPASFAWRWQIYVRFEGLSPYIACLICRSKAVLLQGILCWRDCIICLVLLGKLCLSHFVNLSFTARFIICQYCELLHSCKCIFKCLFRRAVVLLPLPLNPETMSQSVKAWKKGNHLHLSAPSFTTNLWIGSHLRFLDCPNATQASFKPSSAYFSNKAAAITTIFVTFDRMAARSTLLFLIAWAT